MTAFGPFGSAFEGHDSLPRLIGIGMCNVHCICLLNLKDDVCTDYFQEVYANCDILHRQNITDSNKTFWSRSRGSLIGSDSNSWLVATTPGDSDSAPLVCRMGTRLILTPIELPRYLRRHVKNLYSGSSVGRNWSHV